MTSTINNESVSYLITLRINKGPPSVVNKRLIALHPGESVVLGRVSKNHKTDFIAKSTNGYFDNPIISRHHAVLRHDSRGIVIVDQSSTHGTFLNGEKLVPLVPRYVGNGDTITLGRSLELIPRLAEHQPTELEIDIVPMDFPDDASPIYEKSTNSFHAPDTESEDEHSHLERGRIWRPFAVQPAPFDPPVPLPQVLDLVAFEGDSDTSSNADAVLPPVIDLTNENPWVAAEPVHMGCAPVSSENVHVYSIDEDERKEEEEDCSDYDISFALPRENLVPNEDSQVPEAQFSQQENRVTNTQEPTESESESEEEQPEHIDSWDWVRNFLHPGGVDEISEEDSSYQEDGESSISESFYEDEENEEDEEEEEKESDVIDADPDEEASNPEPAQDSVASRQSVEVVINATPLKTVQQTQTPPITPEHLPSSRKRVAPSDDETLVTSSFPIETPSDDHEMVSLLNAENNTLAHEDDGPQQVIKRRRLDDTAEGDSKWVNAAKTLGKYTIAGVVGGIATFVGLAWGGQNL